MASIFSSIEAPIGARLSDVIAEQIERCIVDGELRPGDALPAERELARQLSVSRPSLREALLKLEARKILALRRNAGYTVAEVTAPSLTDPLLHLMESHGKALADVLELRQGLETMAAGLAAMRASTADIERMAEAAEAMEQAHQDGDAALAAEWDARLHLAVAEGAHNLALAHVMRGMFSVMREHVRRAREALFTRHDAEANLREQHRALVEAIRAHDPDAAVRAVEDHLRFVREGIYAPDR
ncbi:Pyruvate dehydrogenase complex repressor [wastewater metagenome]|uniref:Pyruvate dehydrogenase complex repressor n=2 Tax=unclassified sequences TaxID=12908 RepID=A0A5B8R9B6_9ZZZZ|nr:FCD domain-containing protein [Arhodomonas sp. KWT]QEA05141.1 pyruvate dehydrogenase complex repressor [uncultured organism]